MEYNAQEIEQKYYDIWEKRGYFELDSNKHIANGENFCIMMPPPNITGSLHIGHALTYTLQDIITRFKRMEGFRTLWQPGIDHAGIATQNVVERQLLAKGIKKEQIGREAFLEAVWEWKEKSGGEIISQLKRLGASAAWKRMRFTMDKGLQNAVKKAFVAWYEKGLIIQGDYMVNWCTHDGALSDIEVEFEENKGKLYFLKYFLKDSKDFVVVATTRPETYFGDSAVMVNPNDTRYKHLIGQKVILPLIEREVAIIGDEFVDMEFGTGIVKVTPAHDNNDYEVGLRHKLDFITIFDKNGILNKYCGEFEGLERLEARDKIIAKLESCGFVEKIQDYTNQIGKCYRCGNIVEPYISKQWFVKKDIAKETIALVNKGECKFYPNQWINNFNAWMGDLRNWCVSRQLWWGHRIPVFYCDSCHITMASQNDSEKCAKCGELMRQDEDVLDTWFSSGLWAFSTLGWGNQSSYNSSFNPHEVPQIESAQSPQIAKNTIIDSKIKAESKQSKSVESSVESRKDSKINTESQSQKDSNNFAESHNNNKTNPHEVRTYGVVGGGERLRGEGSDFAIQAPSPLAKEQTSDSKNKNNFAQSPQIAKNTIIDSKIKAESKQSKSVESSVESRKDSKINTESQSQKDSNNFAESHNNNKTNPHEVALLQEKTNDSNVRFNESDLEDFYPNSLLITSFDILFFWVARMLFSGESLLKKLPFKDIYLHALVCDEFGRKMSKSVGNVINPLVLINSHSSDILRFCLAYNCIQGRDIRISEKSLNIGNALVVKIINALNFLQLYKEQQNTANNTNYPFVALDSIKSPLGNYMHAKFNICVKEVKNALDAYRFNDGANAIYRFLFNDFCDFGIEAVKAQKEAVFELGGILRETMKLLHPFMPFISEFVWQNLNGTKLEDSTSIMIERFPVVDENLSLNADFEVIRDIITSIRRAKTNIDLANKPIAQSFIKANLNDENLAFIFVPKLAKCEKIEFVDSKREHCIFEIGDKCEIYIPTNEIDLESLSKKIEAKLAKSIKEKEKLESMLNNPNFLKNAPKNLIESNTNALNEAKLRIEKLEAEWQTIKNI